MSAVQQTVWHGQHGPRISAIRFLDASKIPNRGVQQNVLKRERVKDPELWSAAERPQKRRGQRSWTVECSRTSWKENGSELKSAAECPEKRTGQRFWTVECSRMSWKENRSELKSAAECPEKRTGQIFWTVECSRMSWKENMSKILNCGVRQNVLKREQVKDSTWWSAEECPQKRQPMSSWSRSSPVIQWTVHRLLWLTSFRNALKLWNIYKLAGNILPFTMWTWFGAGMYQNCPQAFVEKKKILIKRRTWHPWWLTFSRGRGKWFGHNLKMVAQTNLIHSNSLKGMLAEGMWTTEWPALYLIIIILYSFMCYFSKMEPIAHYKAKSQNTINTNFHEHRYTHTHTHTHPRMHAHMHARIHARTHTHTHSQNAHKHTHTHTHTHTQHTQHTHTHTHTRNTRNTQTHTHTGIHLAITGTVSKATLERKKRTEKLGWSTQYGHRHHPELNWTELYRTEPNRTEPNRTEPNWNVCVPLKQKPYKLLTCPRIVPFLSSTEA